MITRMYADILFDREVTRRHCISSGGYAVMDKDGNELQFDFEYFEGWIDEDNKNLLHIMHKFMDLSCYPEAEHLDKYLENIKCFTEFFVYTGDYDDPEINTVKVTNVVFVDYFNHKEYYIDDKLLTRCN